MAFEAGNYSSQGEEQLFYGLPARAYLKPVSSPEEALAEVRRAMADRALAPTDASRIITAIEDAPNGTAVVEIVTQEWAKGPTCPVNFGQLAVSHTVSDMLA